MTANVPCILLYHEVDAVSRPLLNHYFINLSPRVFETHARTLVRHFKPISVAELREAWRMGEDVRNRVLMTFDDGYRAAVLNAGPILADLGLDSIWFVNSAFWKNDHIFWLSQLMWIKEQGLLKHFVQMARKRWPDICDSLIDLERINWWGKQNYSRLLAEFIRDFAARWGFDETSIASAHPIYASPAELQTLSKTAQIGNHTATHPNLRNLSLADFKHEVMSCHQAIVADLGFAPSLFAFPFGEAGNHWSPLAPQLIKEMGYEAVFSVETDDCAASSGVWPGTLPRHSVPLGPVTESEFKAYVNGLLEGRCL
jgi:peptidoglycan/xylan/chitin deacetylase (PgdA/CDA1 family)